MKGWTSKKKKEESIQISVCSYISRAYPDVIYTAESSGIKLTMGQAVKAKKQRSNRGLPDLMVFEPRGKYHGLMIELKRDGESPYKTDGTLKSKKVKNKQGVVLFDHLEEQQESLNRLSAKKYYACFCVGFDEAKETIDKYMSW